MHCPNEGRRNPRTGAYLKKMGLSKGWPDYTIAVPSNGCHGLYIEMKLPGEEKLKKNPDQVRKLQKLNKLGYYASYAYGFEHAKLLVNNYFNLPLNFTAVHLDVLTLRIPGVEYRNVE